MYLRREWLRPKLTQAEGFILGVGAKMFSCCGARCALADGAAALHTDRGHSLASFLLPLAAVGSLPIAGPVIVYGVSASVVYGLIYWLCTLM